MLGCRSEPGIDIVPTFTTQNNRICLMLSNGKCGMLRIEDSERLQVRVPGPYALTLFSRYITQGPIVDFLTNAVNNCPTW